MAVTAAPPQAAPRGRQHVETRIQDPSHLGRRRHDAGKTRPAPQRVAENDGRLPFGRRRQTPDVRLHAQNTKEIPRHPDRRQLPSRPIRQAHRWLATPAGQRLPIEPLQLRHALGDVPHISQGNILKVPVRRLPPHRHVLPIRHPAGNRNQLACATAATTATNPTTSPATAADKPAWPVAAEPTAEWRERLPSPLGLSSKQTFRSVADQAWSFGPATAERAQIRQQIGHRTASESFRRHALEYDVCCRES